MKDSKEEIGAVNAGTVWRKTNGQWQAIFHAEAKQEPSKRERASTAPHGMD